MNWIALRVQHSTLEVSIRRLLNIICCGDINLDHAVRIRVVIICPENGRYQFRISYDLHIKMVRGT